MSFLILKFRWHIFVFVRPQWVMVFYMVDWHKFKRYWIVKWELLYENAHTSIIGIWLEKHEWSIKNTGSPKKCIHTLAAQLKNEICFNKHFPYNYSKFIYIFGTLCIPIFTILCLKHTLHLSTSFHLHSGPSHHHLSQEFLQ